METVDPTLAIPKLEKGFKSSFELLHWVYRVIVSSIERFYWGNGFSRAASLAYTSLLSLVPITFVVFGFLASFTRSNEDLPKVREFIFKQFIPNQATASIILEKLTEIDKTLNDPNFSTFAIVFFAITALLLINSIEYALNEIWQVYEVRSIAQRLSIFCAILVITPVLAISAYYTTKIRVEPILLGFGFLESWTHLLDHIFSFSIDLIAFFILYFLVPKAPVRVSSAAFGAFLVAVLFNIAKYYFALYIVEFSSYDKIYGALAAIPIFLFWLYLSWSVILFGAELSFQFQYLPRIGRLWKKQVTSVGDGALLLACQSLVLVTRAFTKGEKLPSEQELTAALGCSSIVLRPALDALKRSGMLCQGDTREMPLVLQRSPDTIFLSEIRNALYHDKQPIRCAGEVSTFFRAFSKAEDGKDISLLELVNDIR